MGNFWNHVNKLRKQFRFSIFDHKNLNEVYRVTLSRIQGMGIVGSVWGSGVLFAILILFFTPLKQCIPGYPKDKIQKEIIDAALKFDSLEYQITLRDSFLEAIQQTILGNINDTIDRSSNLKKVSDNIEISEMKSEDIYSDLIGQDVFGFNIGNATNNVDLSLVTFFPPMKGMITNRFSTSGQHYAVDLVGKEHAAVCSVLDGTVVFAEWSISTGYVVVIQHTHDLISIYKHNSELRVHAGEIVKAGELIALMGDEGELSIGPHLHFELWQRGLAVDPEQYILFDDNYQATK